MPDQAYMVLKTKMEKTEFEFSVWFQKKFVIFRHITGIALCVTPVSML